MAEQPVVVIKAVDNGPYQVKGPVRVVDHEGGEHELGPGRTQLLCRCGMSAKKPFCDGAHARNGFAAQERAGS
ncbi:Zn-finger domain of CDGSH type-containing protein [Saccharopolyspora antimicrobica]|uniref:CDGSH-type Zn-finger protein n=1 Tax=Saccharopolyspora antimicrobica TaxID=455193 RepID=A0A1I4TRA4_9PSEU|nr:CDGSH iron-sulfur domain-containing protein [Saccharopolyspora antimicrobica]RKT88522.1 CDGSH-type Zn-finger protein [Saccharopolyspora antimicrobica]SFM79312.1 Zn-finger domain of CDGSH type-containing protein [Saccharopolyspora antimicrobica]